MHQIYRWHGAVCRKHRESEKSFVDLSKVTGRICEWLRLNVEYEKMEQFGYLGSLVRRHGMHSRGKREQK